MQTRLIQCSALYYYPLFTDDNLSSFRINIHMVYVDNQGGVRSIWFGTYPVVQKTLLETWFSIGSSQARKMGPKK